MAQTPFKGAGRASGKSKRENSPGLSGMAKIMLCDFHCSRSSILSSLYKAQLLSFPQLLCLNHHQRRASALALALSLTQSGCGIPNPQ